MINKQYYICITPFFPSPRNWRGAYVLDQVKAIQRNSNFEVVVFLPSSVDYEIEGIKVYGFITRQTPSYLFYGFFDKYNTKQFVKRLNEIDLDCDKIAFVHCHTSHFAAYGLALKKMNPDVKVLLQHHDLDPFAVRNGKLASWRINTYYRAYTARNLFDNVDLHVCISRPVLDNLLSFPHARSSEIEPTYLRVLNNVSDMRPCHPHNTYVLYNGVDTNLFRGKSGKVINYDCYRIGCIGNFQVIKDHITLIRSFEILVRKGYSNFRLSLLGTGETRAMCEKYINTHGLAPYVEWPSEVTHDKLPEYYQSLDLFVLPSVYEGFGCVYTEAYACGVPFMGVLNQGAAECVEPTERGMWLIKPHDERHLADLIEHHYRERNEQHLCQPYDINELIGKFLLFIKEMK